MKFDLSKKQYFHYFEKLTRTVLFNRYAIRLKRSIIYGNPTSSSYKLSAYRWNLVLLHGETFKNLKL